MWAHTGTQGAGEGRETQWELQPIAIRTTTVELWIKLVVKDLSQMALPVKVAKNNTNI